MFAIDPIKEYASMSLLSISLLKNAEDIIYNFILLLICHTVHVHCTLYSNAPFRDFVSAGQCRNIAVQYAEGKMRAYGKYNCFVD